MVYRKISLIVMVALALCYLLSISTSFAGEIKRVQLVVPGCL
jgi:hypothetical protein